MRKPSLDFMRKMMAVAANAAIIAAIELVVAKAVLGSCKKERSAHAPAAQ